MGYFMAHIYQMSKIFDYNSQQEQVMHFFFFRINVNHHLYSPNIFSSSYLILRGLKNFAYYTKLTLQLLSASTLHALFLVFLKNGVIDLIT